jgi:hypothetical protein
LLRQQARGKEDTVVYPKRVAWKPAISAHALRRVADHQRELVEASVLGVGRLPRPTSAEASAPKAPVTLRTFA